LASVTLRCGCSCSCLSGVMPAVTGPRDRRPALKPSPWRSVVCRRGNAKDTRNARKVSGRYRIRWGLLVMQWLRAQHGGTERAGRLLPPCPHLGHLLTATETQGWVHRRGLAESAGRASYRPAESTHDGNASLLALRHDLCETRLLLGTHFDSVRSGTTARLYLAVKHA